MKPLRSFFPGAFLILVIFILSLGKLHSQPGPENSPKREFRGVWIATVSNIDYPKRPTTQLIPLKEEWKNLLDFYQNLGFNAVIAQVRPAGDAFYPTEHAPYSKYLTGQQGIAPKGTFDPLEFMVEEAHKRSMEFHAWVNPYRATVDLDTFNLSQKHVFNRHPEWLLKYGGRFYLNPALPEVRQHLIDIVGEIVEKYDIDAIHMDDYFYPYPKKDEIWSDSTDFAFYGKGFDNIDDWRRSNVDQLIIDISSKIKSVKDHVQFGISPFGVWRNKEQDQSGSETRASISSYDDLHADVLSWIRRGWIDYVIPQLYWNVGFEVADHAELLKWWSARVQDKNLYIGHAAYKVKENPEPAWQDPQEIPYQIWLNRRNYKSQGSVYFSARSIIRDPLGLKDSLKHIYSRPAMIPEMAESAQKTFSAPDLKLVRKRKGAVMLKWKPDKADLEDPPFYYTIYRFEGDELTDFEDSENLLGIFAFNPKLKRFQKSFKFYDRTTKEKGIYTYAIMAVNRHHTESKPSRLRKIIKTEQGIYNAREGE